MRRKILALSLVLAMAASVLSPAAMAQTVSDSLPTVTVTSESTAESTPTAESISTPENAPTTESTSAVSVDNAVAVSESTNAAQPQADEVAIDETNFPDANFREAVKQYDTDGNGIFSQAELDAVQTMHLMGKNIADLKGIEYFTALTELLVNNNQLTELNVSANVALTELDASNNQLTQLDASGCTALTSLTAFNNQLTNLDVSANTALISLNINRNRLTSLDVSANTALTSLEANWNQLTELKVGVTTALENLSVKVNELTQLDVSGCTALTNLEAYGNQLTSVNVSANAVLESLSVGGNQLTSIDVSANTALKSLHVSDNQLTSVDVSANTMLESLNVSNNQLTSVDVSSNMLLKDLFADANKLTSLDLSANKEVNLDYLSLLKMPLIALKLGNSVSWFSVDNPARMSLIAETGSSIDLKTYAPFFDASKVSNVQGGTIDANGVLTGWTEGTPVTYTYDAGFERSFDVSITIQDEAQANEVAIDETNFPDANFREAVKQYDTDGNGSFSQAELDAVRIIDVSNKSIQTLKGIEHFRELLVLTANNNGIEQIDISHNIKLRSLSMNNTAYGIGLTELNTANNPELLSLSLQMNQLTQLDITKNQKLTSINVSWNQLTDIDLSKNEDLKQFEAIGNRLGNLDVSNNTSLESLNVSGQNPLESLDVTKNTELKLLYLNISHLQSLDLSNNVKLENLSLGVSREEADDGIESPLSSLDVSKNVALTELLVSDSQITSLDISNNLKIKRLGISNSQLKALDVSKNIELQTLWLSHNFLKELDLSNNAQLTEFSVASNQLKFLDLSSNAALKSLYAVENPLMGLEVGGEISVNCDIDNPTQVSLTAEAGTPIDLKTYAPFFDASKVSNVQGGAIDTNGVLTGWTEGTPVTYTYDAGFEKVLNVEITIQDEAQVAEVAIDETNFPDANFREAVKQYDTDGNGSFSQAELDAVTALYLMGKNIADLKGIEYFTALTSLWAESNQLTSLDVSANTALTSLRLNLNQLTSLDVSANTALTELDVTANQLTSLDVSANTALTRLSVFNNQLTELNLSANAALTSLDAGLNQLTSLDVSGCTALTSLSVSESQLTSLDVSGCTALTSLNVSSDQLMELNVSKNTVLTKLSVYAKQLSDLDLRNCTALTKLDVSSSQLTSLDLSKNTELKELTLNDAQLASLNLSANTALTQLWVYGTQLTTLDLSKNTALTYLFAGNNRLSALDLSANKALGSLSIQEGLLTSLDVSANTALQAFGVADTPLTSLDLSIHKQLAQLVIQGVPLTALKLGSVPSFGCTIDNPTKVSLTAETGTAIELKTYAPFFDASKVSNVQGGTIDTNGVLTGWTSGSPVTYTYDAGFEKVLNVSIVITDENAPGLSLVANPLSKTYNGKAVTEQELIAGAKATYDGKEVSGKWSVENLPEMKDVGMYRPVLTFTPDSDKYEGGTIETSVQINPASFHVGVGLSNGYINTGDKLPTAFLHYNGAVNGEVLQSTVEPVFTGMPETATAGSYTIVLSNAKEVLESLKAQPTAKNYTIHLWDKASLFISNYIQLPNTPTSPVEGTTGRLMMEETFTNVPESLKAVGLDSVEKVTNKLLASVTGAAKDNTVVYDVHYSISADGQTWNALTPEQFPKEGLTITLPYPEGVDTKANDFTAMHMFTQDVNGFKTGGVEVIKAVKTDAGLQMTVKGFSPIAITWAKAGTTPPTDGGNSGNGGNVVTPPTGGNGSGTQPITPNPGTGAIAQTGDNSAVAVWGIVMALCATAAAGLMIVKTKGKKKQ